MINLEELEPGDIARLTEEFMELNCESVYEGVLNYFNLNVDLFQSELDKLRSDEAAVQDLDLWAEMREENKNLRYDLECKILGARRMRQSLSRLFNPRIDPEA